MKKRFLFLSLAALLVAGACKETTIADDQPETETPTNPDDNAKDDVVVVKGEISEDTKWTKDKIYTLQGFVYVSNGATLTIEPGTIIKGDKASKGTLIITRGAKINAEGTADQPIVFTSALPAGARDKGDWGGVILLGKAPVNAGSDVKIEGGLTAPAGKDEKDYFYYGGSDESDNSGVLKYVRIEFAGIAFSPDNEINGLTLGGVGNGTTIDYVQVYRSGDDAIEWFGGTVNAKHLLAVGTWDDDFDTDFGYSGHVQFAAVQRVPSLADVSGSNAFESDNNGDGANVTPQTSAVFSNVTVLGPRQDEKTAFAANYQHGVHFRRNSSISIANSVISGFVLAGINVDNTKVETSAATSDNLLDGDAIYANNLFYGNKVDIVVSGADDTKDAVMELLKSDNVFDGSKFASNVYKAPYMFAKDLTATNIGTPDFSLVDDSPAASGADFSAEKLQDSFFEQVDYKGAFGDTDWTKGWAHYDPQNLAYDAPNAVK